MFMLITLLNDGTLMAIGYDNVIPSERPQRWNLPALFAIASVLSAVACASSLMLLWVALDCISNYEHSWFHGLGISKIEQGQVVTLLYLKISISDFLTLFSARTQDNWFFSYMPSKILFVGATLSLFVSTMVAAFWPPSTPDEIMTVGLAKGSGNTNLLPIWVWIYCIVWWFIQDIAKMIMYKLMDRFDWFHFRTMSSGQFQKSLHHRRSTTTNEPTEMNALANETSSRE